MKQFNMAVARVRDGKKFVPLTAVKGENVYDTAVRYGYTGTESEYINELMSGGWAGAVEQLGFDVESLRLSKADKEYVDEQIAVSQEWQVLADVTTTSAAEGQIPMTIPLSNDLSNYNEINVILMLLNSDNHDGTVSKYVTVSLLNESDESVQIMHKSIQLPRQKDGVYAPHFISSYIHVIPDFGTWLADLNVVLVDDVSKLYIKGIDVTPNNCFGTGSRIIVYAR